MKLANGGIPVHFLFDPCWRQLERPQHRTAAREAWEDGFRSFSEFWRQCKDEDFKPIILEQSRDLEALDPLKFGLHCMKVVMKIREGDEIREVFCDERLTQGNVYCPLHLATGVANPRLAVFEKITEMVRGGDMESFSFGRNVMIKMPRMGSESFQFITPNLVGVEENFKKEVQELDKVIAKCFRHFRKSDNVENFPENMFRFSLGSPAPFPSWKIFYVVLKEKVELLGQDIAQDWRSILNLLVPLVASQGWTKVSKSFFTPIGENSNRPDYRIKNHDEKAVCYNATATTEGRLIFEVNGLQMAPKRKNDQQELPLYSVETDLLQKVDDFAAVLYVAMASRIMFVDIRNSNKGKADAVLRNDTTTNAGFRFTALKLINITDLNRPAEHDLSVSTSSSNSYFSQMTTNNRNNKLIFRRMISQQVEPLSPSKK